MSPGAPAADRLAGLSREQRALLFEQVRKRKEAAAAPSGRIPRRPASMAAVPASFAQERLWFMDRLAPGNPAFNISYALRLRGRSSPAVVTAVLNEVVRRHEALRTTFAERGGQPLQVIAPPAAAGLRLPVIDLAALPAGRRAAAVRGLAERESQWRFRLESGPLLRTLLLRLAPDEHVLMLVMHHIISDGWSMGVLAREITAVWRVIAAAGAAPLPPLPIQYADFALWQRSWLSGAELERQVDYWRQRLAGAADSLDLPADRPRPAAQTYRGAQLRGVLAAGLMARLRQLARQHEASPYMALLAGFQALLGRLSGQGDLSVGSPIANRNRAELEPLIGFFVNTLVMRGDLAGDPPFDDLLARTRKSALEAFAHQDLPFERLVVELRPERRLSVTPLFQVVCALQNAPLGGMDLPGLTVAPVPLEVTTAQFDLELHGWEQDDGSLLAMVYYSTELFDAATARRFVGQLDTLLDAATDDPGLRLTALPLLTAAERHQLLREWSQGGPSPALGAPDLDIATRVLARAAQTPDAVAVAWSGGELRYGELAARATQLAGDLASLGVAADTLVGVCAGRSPELVIGALTVLLAGGAYLPLDPSYPRQRLAAIVRQSGIRILLAAGTAGVAGGPADWAAPEVRVLPIARPAPPAAGDPAARAADPRQLAYVIYTSGSTGQPKGVAISRHGLAAMVAWHLDAYAISGQDRSALLASPAFDASVWEMWPYLAAGASLHIPDDEVRLMPDRLLAWLAAQAITLAHPTTPMAEPLLAQLDATGAPPGLRLRAMLTGGDRLQRRPRQGLGFELFNHYGPTESSVVATAARVEPPPESSGVGVRPPSIGRPIAGSRAYVVDARLAPAAALVPGELLLGGEGLARGYAAAPDQTAQRFVPDPFAAAPGGQRLYRTGDLVRWLPDGTLEFLGRLDSQVKLRGFRIELGEIGSTLQRHPAVAAAAVGLVDTGGGPRLAAWVVPRTQAELAAAGWQPAGDDHVAQWRRLYDETYQAGQPAANGAESAGTPGTAAGEAGESDAPADFNLRGWNSSYTGQAIPPEEMREWVDGTVERLLSLAPRRVLEIGCGTGLLLLRVAPHTESYLATDFSRVALAGIRRRLDQPGRDLPQVRLLEAAADDWSGIPAGAFDLVILNSVVQYFPGVDYLLRVLAGAVHALAPGGAIFVGDVRSLPLLPAQALSVELFQAPDACRTDDLARRVRRRVVGEEELALDPRFFGVAARRLGATRDAAVLIKRGRAHNELTRFRYDALLRFDTGAAGQAAPVRAAAWHSVSGLEVDADGLDLPAIENLLRDLAAGGTAAGSESLVLSRLPNARLAAEAAALALLERHDRAAATAGELRQAAHQRATAGVDPEALWQLAHAHGWDADLLVEPTAPVHFAAVLRRRAHPAGAQGAAPASVPASAASGAPEAPLAAAGLDTLALQSLANDPLRGPLERRLVPELRRDLAARLPDYMVPAAFVLLDRLPLTHNGKVDQAALPAPDALGDAKREGTPPHPGLEARLAAVWGELLGIATPGGQAGEAGEPGAAAASAGVAGAGAAGIAREDNFFELGGHSLLATQLVSRLRTVFGVDLPLRRVFEKPVLADLCDALAQELAAHPEAAALVALTALAAPPVAGNAAVAVAALDQPAGPVEAPLSFAQERFWAATRDAPTAYNVPSPLRLVGALRHQVVERCFGEVLRRHGTLRTRFVERADGELRQVVEPPRPWHLPQIDLSRLPAAARQSEARRLVDEDTCRPFDLAAGKVFRAALARLTPGEHVLLINAHHIVVDGWSMGLMVGELTALYHAFANGQASPLPELTARYVDLALEQRQRLSGAVLAERLDLWQRRLAGAPPMLALPTDRPRPLHPTHRGDRIRRLLPTVQLERLKAISNRARASLYMTLLAALALVLERVTGQHDMVVGTPLAGRLRAESEPLIGVFLNMLPLRVDLTGSHSFAELLPRVRKTVLEGFENQEVPFEPLLRRLGLRRQASHYPLFQITLNMLNLPETGGRLPGLAVEPLPLHQFESKYDFTLYAIEVPDGLILDLLYSRELFDRPRMDALLDDLMVTLDHAVATDPVHA